MFIPELILAENFYNICVKPILSEHFPTIPYSAALIGDGSGVQGLDTELSSDHDWGLRLLLFLPEDSTEKDAISHTLEELLPQEFNGHPTRFSKGGSPVTHQVAIYTVPEYLTLQLGINSGEPIRPIDWLTFPQQKLRALTQGKDFYDGLDQLVTVREKLAYYPQDVWLYLLASQWQILSEEMPFVGRCGDVGDEIGSRVIGAYQVHRIMELAFLVERQYAPYSKWFGTVFSRLSIAKQLQPVLLKALAADQWKIREQELSEAYKILVSAFNELQLLPAVQGEAALFFTRPYTVVEGPDPDDIQQLIEDRTLKSLPIGMGGIDQITDNVHVLEKPNAFRRSINFFQ